uniref:Metalloendopeptidase n=1 Tax=Colubraria reticulata TaxID=604273 RepID=A0A330LI62_9CAEN|nr:Astacin/ShKT-like domain containing protein ASA58a [Colubraria reticulata]
MRMTGAVKARSSQRLLSTPWTDGIIPYSIDSFFNVKQVNWIEDAMQAWEKFTCVRFRPRTALNTSFVTIRTGERCNAHLGMKGGERIVELHPTCFWKGIIEHEFGHTLGLIHEHERENRDGYIKVNYQAAKSEAINFLTKMPKGVDDKLGLEYDYASVMHYDKFSFSKTGYDQTLYTRDPEATDVIGMGLGPSYIDIKLVNMMYNCPQRCAHPPAGCGADCIVLANCQCFCKEDMPKEWCQDTAPDCAHLARSAGCTGERMKMHTECRKTCGLCTTDGTAPQLPCEDVRNDCNGFHPSTSCQENSHLHDNMKKYCRKTCGFCDSKRYKSLGECNDKNTDCRKKAAAGWCDKDPGFMLKNCRQACDQCVENLGQDPVTSNDPNCQNYDAICTFRKDLGWCQTFFSWMSAQCPESCNTCGYKIPSGCVDKFALCRSWAIEGECASNPSFMHWACELSCNSCPRQEQADKDPKCQGWAKGGYCPTSDWMMKNCANACHKYWWNN